MLKRNKRCCLVASSLFLILLAQATHAQSARERHERVRAAIDGSDYSTAITELQSWRSAEPMTFTLNNYDYLLARLSERRGDAATASANYQKVLARNSLLSQYALWHLAQLARATGDLTLEREKLRQLIATAPTSLLRDAAMARLGQSFYESGDYASAIQTLRPRSSANGNSSAREALALIGEAYLKSGQKDAARDAFNNLVTQLPNPSQPDDFALAGVRAAHRNRVALKQFDDADRRARRERLFSQREATDVDRIEPVNILRRINRLNHTLLINAARQRQLDEHSIHIITRIELTY